MTAEPKEAESKVQALLRLMRDGDTHAREALIHHASRQLRKLTQQMLRDFPQVHRWEQTDDVLQNALIRLHRALTAVQPESERHFFNLAALQIRRELLDLAKRHQGPDGLGANHHTDGEGRAADDPGGPLEGTAAPPHNEQADLEAWAHFHEQVERLPDEEREVFRLLWYEGLSREEAAAVLGVTVRTVKRRWQRSRLLLYQALQGEEPAAPGSQR